MGWCTTSDLDRFTAAAGGYLRSRTAENTLLLSAVQAARSKPVTGLLFGWWEPPDGGDPRGAFLHDPAVPLLIAGRVPEMAAALAGILAKMGRQVCGVDAPTEAADAFAAAWSQRAGTAVRAHRQCRVYRLTAEAAPGTSRAPGAAGAPGAGGGPGAGAWPPAEIPGPDGRLRVATPDDLPLLADWLTAFAAETAERTGPPAEVAADLISYGGAIFWEVPQKSSRLRDAAHYLAIPHHRDTAQFGEPVHQPVALATLTRPAAGSVRISRVYTLPERRQSGYAPALTLAVSRAVLVGGAAYGAAEGAEGVHAAMLTCGCVDEVVMISDRNRPDRWGGRLGYHLVSDRAVLRFGPATGPMPRVQATGPMPRLPTGPLPRFRR